MSVPVLVPPILKSRQRSGKCRLHWLAPSGDTLDRDLDAEKVIIGRASDADIQLDTENVSGHHAILTSREGEFTLTDAGSHAGLYLNGIRIHSAALRHGDLIQLAGVMMTFEEG